MAAPTPAPITLEGNLIRLEPIRREHASFFYEVAREALDDLFRWFPWSMRTIEDFSRYIDQVLVEQNAGLSIGFATVIKQSGQIVGSTRYMNIDEPNRHLEIRSTWIIPKWQRTAVNTEAKYLMLRHAFEERKCLRVELKTDALNHRSRTGILRLGAKEEGTFRKHIVVWDGRVRDSVYYSILDSEWPHIKLTLEQRLSQT